MAFDQIGEVVHVDHGALDSGRGETIQHMIDQRFAGDRNERFRHPVG